jgi:hypothetical protein
VLLQVAPDFGSPSSQLACLLAGSFKGEFFSPELGGIVVVTPVIRIAGILAVTGFLSVAAVPGKLLAAPVLTALYDPVNGNITMQALDDGVPAVLDIATFQFLSPAHYLSGETTLIPASASSGFTVLNTSTSFVVDPPSVHAEIYATNLGSGTPLFTSTWNLGNVAALGLTQAQIIAGFTTDPDSTPGEQPVPGHFLYQVQGGGFFTGQITAVPEPSGIFLAVSASVAGALWTLHRTRRRTIAA